MSAGDYNEVFSAALRSALGCSPSDYPLKNRVEELTKNNEVEQLFPGHGKLWLQKELSKWRGKLSADDQRFCATLQSLQIYCALTGQTPNDVLLPARRYNGPARVEFLRFETIMELARALARGDAALRHACALPVLYSPERMTAVFLFLYPMKRAGRDTVCMRFGISEPDGYVDADGIGGISTAPDSSYYIADLSHPEGMERLREAYEKIRGEFEAVCASAESQLGESVRDFYAMMGDWTQEERSDQLFSWFPPSRAETARRQSLDSLRGAEGFRASPER
ncbi:MAG: hypothetical protein IKM11_04550 [Oscillospiraceae bacterium]|nr:hypothetical protein [Oscillospiraceae bacterium]